MTSPWMPSGRPGWVYVLTNPTLPGICKIGRTCRPPAVRSSEVSRAYGVAAPFVVASKHAVPDAPAVEWMTHRRLRRCRLPASELFNCDARTAAETIKTAVLAYRPPRWRCLRRIFTPGPKQTASRRTYRRGTNCLPVLLLLAIAAGVVSIAKPTPASWWPAPVAHTVLFLERLR